MDFKKWLLSESELHTFVQSMLHPQERYSPTIRLITADWLEEQNDPVAEFIRIAYQMGQMSMADPRFSEINKEYHTVRKKIVSELVKYDVHVNFSTGEVHHLSDMGYDVYSIRGNHIFTWDDDRRTWKEVKNIQKIPKHVLRGIVMILGHRLAELYLGREDQAEFQRANRELHNLILNIEERYIYRDRNIPQIALRRLGRALDYVLATISGASEEDRSNLISNLSAFIDLAIITDESDDRLTRVIQPYLQKLRN